MKRVFGGGRYANVTSTMALIVALGGTAYAANSVRSSDIVNGQVKSADIGSKQVKNADLGSNAVTSAKVKDGSLLKRDFKAGELPAGPAGANGANGAKGDKGDPGESGVTVYDSVLQSGRTITGTYAAGGGDANATSVLQTAITFLPRLAAPIPHANVHVVALAGAPPECPAPGQAAAGHLCIYETVKNNATFAFEIKLLQNLGASGTDTIGAALRWNSTGSASNVAGSWAVTAP